VGAHNSGKILQVDKTLLQSDYWSNRKWMYGL